MRSGACSVQQALTTEAASVLKLSLTLARRRGHAQVTPLHVAATLLTSTTSSSSTSNPLRRACLKSHPHHLASHPLQCRALELCFNVALNRLPTTPPPSSSSLIHTQPSLSNALIAALKRAQAHQRRGCIEQQQHFQHHQQQQQQQPLLAIKVELDQLIISILDDPSVSRVMREAGFSSTTVKNNLEEDAPVSSSTSSLSPSNFFFDSSNREIITQATLLHTHFFKSPSEQNPVPHFSYKEDLRVVLEVMLRKQGRRNNTVVVGDSVSVTEGIVGELMGRVERGEVPDELKSSHFIKLQLSYVHLRLMTKAEVELKVSDLRRKVESLASGGCGGGVIIYVGDLRWALDEEPNDGFKAMDHLIEEVGKLVSELKAVSSKKVWLMATASYQTYMRCQVRQPSLESQWGLQAVVVPSGGLALSLQAPSGQDSRVPKLNQYPFQILEPKAFHPKEDEAKLLCCAECTSNFEKEASMFKSDAKDTNSASTQLPFWLQQHRPNNNNQKDTLAELKRKWNKLCRNLQHSQHKPIHGLPPYPSSHPWWTSSSLTYTQNKTFIDPHFVTSCEFTPKPIGSHTISTAQFKYRDASKPWLSDVKTTLALGSPLFTDTATSIDQRSGIMVNSRELSRRLQENIPWQSETIPSIMEALLDCHSSGKKGTLLLVQGNDFIGKRRLARVVAETFCGSANKLTYINTTRLENGTETLTEAMRKDPKCVVLIEDINRASTNLVKSLVDAMKIGFLKDPFGREVDLAQGIFILATSSSTELDLPDECHKKILKMRFWVEEEEISFLDHKRKNSELDLSLNEKEKKKSRAGENEIELDLNVCAEESDLTHEIDGNDEVHLPRGLLESIGSVITMEGGSGGVRQMAEGYAERLSSAAGDGGRVSVDRTAVEGLMGAMGWFLDSEFERWVREVFELSLVTVGKGGKVRLGVEGKEGNFWEYGFLGTVLPNKIHVD